MKQGTKEWLELRRTKITATDAAVIMDVSPYKTKYVLWVEKKYGQERELNAAMIRGSEMEESLRERYCAESGIEFIPHVLVPDNSFQMASLDGIDFDKEHILEIKTTNKKYFEMVENGVVPDHFYAQIQHQLMCAPTVKEAHLVCENGGKINVLKVYRNKEYQENLYKKEEEFYELLKGDTAPEQVERDYVVIEESDDMEKLYSTYKTLEERKKEIKAALKELEDEQKIIKSQILDFTDDGNSIYKSLRMTKSYVCTYDYKKACVDHKIDVEKYKRPSVRWTFTVKKEVS